MKARIITCHYAYNYGAVLQTYALCSFMNNAGVSTEVINYRPYYYRGSTRQKNKLKLFLRKIARIPDNIKSEKVFVRFLETYIPMTREFRSYEQLATEKMKADLFIAGSDQIWNPVLPNGKDYAFYLRFADKNAYKISYAASISTDRLTKGQQRFMKENLADFDMISVREKTGQKLLQKCGITDVSTEADPVYLLERTEWLRMAKKPKGLSSEKYIFVYAFNRQKHVFEAAKKLARKNGWKVYSVNTFWEDVFQGTDHYYWNCKPEEFLYLIRHAECIVTNSFHGLSFSLIFNRPVVLFEKDDNGNSRMMDLLDNLGVGAQIIARKGEGDISIPALDYKVINERLKAMRVRSAAYLSGAIDQAEKKQGGIA